MAKSDDRRPSSRLTVRSGFCGFLEELGVPCEIKDHKRDPKTRFAPPALKEIHPLGKSPVIEPSTGGGTTLLSSGAGASSDGQG